jgi:hypothetical protein
MEGQKHVLLMSRLEYSCFRMRMCVCEYIIFWKIDDCNVHVTAEIQLGILRDFSSIRKYKIFLP